MRARAVPMLLIAGACALVAPGAASAQGGLGEGVSTTPAPVAAACADVVVTSSGGVFHKDGVSPKVSGTIASCSTRDETVRLTLTDRYTSLYYPADPCNGTQVVDLGALAIRAGGKVSFTANAPRGLCGLRERHSVTFTATDAATGAVLDTAFYGWYDATGV